MREESCQQQPVALSAGKNAHRRPYPIRGKEKVLKVAIDVASIFVDRHEIAAARYVVKNGGVFVENMPMLIEVGHVNFCAASDGSRLGLETRLVRVGNLEGENSVVSDVVRSQGFLFFVRGGVGP